MNSVQGGALETRQMDGASTAAFRERLAVSRRHAYLFCRAHPSILGKLETTDLMALIGYVVKYEADAELTGFTDDLRKNVGAGRTRELTKCYEALKAALEDPV